MMTDRPLVRCVFRADESFLMLSGPQTMAQIRALIGCELTDSVMLGDRVHVMIVDDLGHQRGLRINTKGTRLYLDARPDAPGDFVIRGDVVVVPDSDFAMPNGEPFRNRPL